jgi:FkbM family methyltransferase
VFRNWWAWILPKLGFSVTLELKNGLRYFVRSGTTDMAVINEAAILNPYIRPGYLELPMDAVVVDVGANIGDFAVQMAVLCPRGHVYAVEPVSNNIEMIALNKMLNGLANLHILHLALGSGEGEIEINLSGGQSSAFFKGGGRKTEKVRLTSLECLMREQGIERIDLLKLDCEGAEWDILPCSTNLFPKIRQICMEFHLARGWTPEKLAAWLCSAGYRVNHTGGRWNGLLWATQRHNTH